MPNGYKVSKEIRRKCRALYMDPDCSLTYSEIGRMYGISRTAVGTFAKEDGAPIRRVVRGQNTMYIEDDWAPVDKLMGTVPDHELSKRFPMSKSCIAKRRRNLGIPAFRQRDTTPIEQPPDDISKCLLSWGRPEELDELIREIRD